MTRIQYQLIVVVLLLCCFSLAVNLIEQRSMWYDEWFSWHYSSRTLLDTLETAEDVHPPGYYIVLWLWNQWTGSDQLFVMRYSSVLLGILALASATNWAKRAFNQSISIVMVAFVGSSGVYLYYMHELRMYSLVVLLAVMSWWWLDRLLKQKRGAWLGYGVVLAGMAYTYYFTVFMVIPQFLLVWVYGRKNLLRLLWAYLLAGCLIVPWLPTFLQQLQFDSKYASYGVALPVIGLIGKGSATQPTDWQSFRSFLEQYTAGQLSFVLGLGALGILLGWKQYRQHYFYWGVLGWSLGVTALFFTVNLVMPVYHPRYLLMILPSLGMLIGLGFDSFPRTMLITITTMVMINGVLTTPHGFDVAHPPHRAILGLITERFRAGDVIWYNMDSGARGSSLFGAPSYYIERVYTQITSDDFVWAAPSEFVADHDDRRVWDVRDVYTIPPADTLEALQDRRYLTEMVSFSPFVVRLYEPMPIQSPVRFGELFNVRYHAERDEVVKLWFEVLQQPDRDYSYGLHVWDAQGNVIHQWDGVLKETVFENPTLERVSSQWLPQPESYFMAVPYALPPDLASGEYTLNLTIYEWQVAPSGLALDETLSKPFGRDFITLMSFTR